MSIAKFDIDVKMSQDLLDKFIETRLVIVETLGYTPICHSIVETEKGYHFWIEVLETLKERELAELQFLLGDDQIRCRFNFLRLDLGVFSWFNALFSMKRKRR